MILKLKYSTEPDDQYQPTEYIQCGVISIDEDKLYAIIDDGQDVYYEIEAIPNSKKYILTKHISESEEYEAIDTESKFDLIEILTDSLAVIQKWERK